MSSSGGRTSSSGGSGSSVALTDRGNWATTTAYVVGDTVTQTGWRYICNTAHTSGTFATDLAAGKWDLTGAVTLPNTETGQNVTASTSTTPVNVTAGSVVNVALNANTTVSFTSAPASPWGLLIVFTQDATGGRTVAFSGLSGPAPSIGSAANAVTGVAVTRDNAGNIYAAVAFTA